MDTLSSPPLKPAEETLTELDKHLLKELKRGPKTPETTNEDGTPNEDPHPWKTSMKKWIKTCKSYLDNGANINCQKQSNKQTPLIIVCSKKIAADNEYYYRMINFTLDYGADVTIKDKFGMTALHHAAYHGNFYACQVLLDTLKQENNLGEYIDALDAANLTPLHEASCAGEAKVVKLLIKWGANTDITDVQERTALDLAKQFEREKVIHLLTTKIEDWSSDEETSGETALIDAIKVANSQTKEVSDKSSVAYTNGKNNNETKTDDSDGSGGGKKKSKSKDKSKRPKLRGYDTTLDVTDGGSGDEGDNDDDNNGPKLSKKSSKSKRKKPASPGVKSPKRTKGRSTTMMDPSKMHQLTKGKDGKNKSKNKNKSGRNTPEIDLNRRLSIGSYASDNSDGGDDTSKAAGAAGHIRREKLRQRQREQQGGSKKLKEQLVARNKEIVELKSSLKTAKSEVEKYKKQINKYKENEVNFEKKKKEIITHYESRLKETKKYSGIKQEIDKKHNKMGSASATKASTTVPKAEFEELEKKYQELKSQAEDETRVFAKAVQEKDRIINELQAKLDANATEIKELKEEQINQKRRHKEQVDSILSGYDGVRQALKERRDDGDSYDSSSSSKRHTSAKSRSAEVSSGVIAKKRQSKKVVIVDTHSRENSLSSRKASTDETDSIGSHRRSSVSGTNTKLARKQQRFVKWLKEDVCLDKHLSKFVDSECNRLDIVKMMDDDDLKDIGINHKFDRKLILSKIEELKLQSERSSVLTPMAKKISMMKLAAEAEAEEEANNAAVVSSENERKTDNENENDDINDNDDNPDDEKAKEVESKVENNDDDDNDGDNGEENESTPNADENNQDSRESSPIESENVKSNKSKKTNKNSKNGKSNKSGKNGKNGKNDKNDKNDKNGKSNKNGTGGKSGKGNSKGDKGTKGSKSSKKDSTTSVKDKKSSKVNDKSKSGKSKSGKSKKKQPK